MLHLIRQRVYVCVNMGFWRYMLNDIFGNKKRVDGDIGWKYVGTTRRLCFAKHNILFPVYFLIRKISKHLAGGAEMTQRLGICHCPEQNIWLLHIWRFYIIAFFDKHLNWRDPTSNRCGLRALPMQQTLLRGCLFVLRGFLTRYLCSALASVGWTLVGTLSSMHV